MRLHLLREHYVKRGSKWVPKRKFSTREEIEKQPNINLDECNIYKCTMCAALHVGRMTNDSKR